MAATFQATLKTLFACFEGLVKKPAAVENPNRLRRFGPLVPAENHVVINGVELEYIEDDWPLDHALGEIMLHLDVTDINTIYVPTTRLEKLHGVAPRVFVPFQNQTYSCQYVDGEVMWRPFGATRKIEYQLHGNLVMKPRRLAP